MEMVIGTYVSPPSLTSAVGVGGAVGWWGGELLLLWALSSESLPPKKNRFILLKKNTVNKKKRKGEREKHGDTKITETSKCAHMTKATTQK